ncbi:MAG: hypothetical protein Q8P78_01260 [bacterium]|nr:hypothetical protein [bacterium]
MRAYLAVMSAVLFLSACGGQDPVSSRSADSVSVDSGLRPPAAKAISRAVAGTKEVRLRLALIGRAGNTVEIAAVVDGLDGRTLAGWDVWVKYDSTQVIPSYFRPGHVTGSPEENYGIGDFLVANNPSFESSWGVAAASAFGSKREGSLFTLVFERVDDTPLTDLAVGFGFVQLLNEEAARYSVAIVPATIGGGGITPAPAYRLQEIVFARGSADWMLQTNESKSPPGALRRITFTEEQITAEVAGYPQSESQTSFLSFFRLVFTSSRGTKIDLGAPDDQSGIVQFGIPSPITKEREKILRDLGKYPFYPSMFTRYPRTVEQTPDILDLQAIGRGEAVEGQIEISYAWFE